MQIYPVILNRFLTFFASWVGDPVLDEAAEASAELLSFGLRQIFFRDALENGQDPFLTNFMIAALKYVQKVESHKHDSWWFIKRKAVFFVFITCFF